MPGEHTNCRTMVPKEHPWHSILSQALDRLLAIAQVLRRNNADKWQASLADWQAAVSGVLIATEDRPDDNLTEANLAIRSAVRRLANSGEARFGSVSVGRLPDSSFAGQRFVDDIEFLLRQVETHLGHAIDPGVIPNRTFP